jgi:hypothetical protein
MIDVKLLVQLESPREVVTFIVNESFRAFPNRGDYVSFNLSGINPLPCKVQRTIYYCTGPQKAPELLVLERVMLGGEDRIATMLEEFSNNYEIHDVERNEKQEDLSIDDLINPRPVLQPVKAPTSRPATTESL